MLGRRPQTSPKILCTRPPYRHFSVYVTSPRQAFRDQPAAAGETDPVLRVIADGFIAAHATLCQAADNLDEAVRKKTKSHPVARRLMTIAGVGPFNALVDDPSRFNQASDIGAFLGLTPKRHQSARWIGQGACRNSVTALCAACCLRRHPA